MTLIARSANCTKVIWVEAAPKKKNVKTAVTGVIVVMPRRKPKAEITKISLETVSTRPAGRGCKKQMRGLYSGKFL
jgi:hypothetical protein